MAALTPQPPENDGQPVAAPVCNPGTAASRKEFVTGDQFGLDPCSLIGSWFHRLENDEIVWQGVVVGEPSASCYLIAIDCLGEGAKNVQRLMPLDQMVKDEDGYDWRFYDSEEECRVAYANWIAREIA